MSMLRAWEGTVETGNRRQPEGTDVSPLEGRAHPLLQETLLGEAVASLLVPFLVFDETGSLIAVNDAACGLTGWSRAELLERPVDTLAGEPGAGERLRSELLHRGRVTGSGLLRTRRGDLVRTDYVGAATRVAGVLYFAVVVVPRERRRELAGDLHREVRSRAGGV